MPNESPLPRFYLEALHAVQTGVAYEIEKVGLNEAGCSPKDLRVGINSAMVNDSGLVELLIAKGLFTQEEYHAAITKAANVEADRYQEFLRKLYGVNITLH